MSCADRVKTHAFKKIGDGPNFVSVKISVPTWCGVDAEGREGVVLGAFVEAITPGCSTWEKVAMIKFPDDSVSVEVSEDGKYAFALRAIGLCNLSERGAASTVDLEITPPKAPVAPKIEAPCAV